VNKSPATGVITDLREACANLVDMLKTRVALCAIETEQHLWRLLTLMWVGFAALTCVALTLIFVSVFVIVMLWDKSRLLAIGTVAFSFALLSIGFVSVLLKRLSSHPHWLSATTLELQKDSISLRGSL